MGTIYCGIDSFLFDTIPIFVEHVVELNDRNQKENNFEEKIKDKEKRISLLFTCYLYGN